MKAISLKIQLTFLVILLITCLVAVFSYTVATTEKSMILSDLVQKAVLRGQNFALSSSKPLLHRDPEFELHPLISRVITTDGNIVSITVVNREGLIKGHKDVISIDKEYLPTPGLKPIAGGVALQNNVELRENDDILEVCVPVTDQDEIIGFVYLQYSKNEVYEAVAGLNRRMVRIGFIALAFGALISLLLALHITRPISVLMRGAEAIGLGDFKTRISVSSGKELQALAHTFNEMARGLEKSRNAMREKERMDKELEIAHDIQSSLLPSRLPRFASFEIDAYYHPASQVGGDYYDIISVDDRHLMVIVADVAGKGVPGLVVMAMVRIIVRDLAIRRESPAGLLRRLNILLKKDIKNNIFVTLFCGLLDMVDNTLTLASAAHMPLLLYRGGDGSVHTIGTGTKPLGIFPDEIFSRGLEEKTIRLGPGDVLMQYTDGLTEMMNGSGEEFGLERVVQITRRAAGSGVGRLLGELRTSLEAFRAGAAQSDDLTLLALGAMPAEKGGTESCRDFQVDAALIDR